MSTCRTIDFGEHLVERVTMYLMHTDRQTDGQTTYRSNTSLCTVKCVVKWDL